MEVNQKLNVEAKEFFNAWQPRLLMISARLQGKR